MSFLSCAGLVSVSVYDHVVAPTDSKRSEQLFFIPVSQRDSEVAGLNLCESAFDFVSRLCKSISEFAFLSVIVAEDSDHVNLQRPVVVGHKRGGVIAGMKDEFDRLRVQSVDYVFDSWQTIMGVREYSNLQFQTIRRF